MARRSYLRFAQRMRKSDNIRINLDCTCRTLLHCASAGGGAKRPARVAPHTPATAPPSAPHGPHRHTLAHARRRVAPRPPAMRAQLLRALFPSARLSQQQRAMYAALAASLFCTIGAYWIIRPVKIGVLVATIGIAAEPRAKIGSAFVLAGAVALYSVRTSGSPGAAFRAWRGMGADV